MLFLVEHARGRKGWARREMEHGKVSTAFWSLSLQRASLCFLHGCSVLLAHGFEPEAHLDLVSLGLPC